MTSKKGTFSDGSLTVAKAWDGLFRSMAEPLWLTLAAVTKQLGKDPTNHR